MAPNFQTCRGCLQRYDGTHQPRLLPCGHSLCSKCIDRIKDKHSQKCLDESCRRSWFDSDVNQFPTIFKLMDYSDRPSETPSEPTYRSCNVCMVGYDNGDHEPLILGCGHVACNVCLRSLIAEDKLNCPQCTKPWKGTVLELKVVKDLIPPNASRLRTRNLPSASNGATTRPRPLLRGDPGESDLKRNVPIFVKNMGGSGNRQKFTVDLDSTVLDLKRNIHKQLRLRVDDQSLMFNGNYLVDTRTLRSYSIVADSEVIITCRLRGG